MFSSIGPGMEQLCVNKSHDGSWCEFFEKRDQAKSTPLKLLFNVFSSSVKQTKFQYPYNIGKTPLAASG